MLEQGKKGIFHIPKTRFLLVLYDLLIFIAVELSVFFIYEFSLGKTDIGSLPYAELYHEAILSFVFLSVFRFSFKVYSQIWRYGSTSSYVLLFISDLLSMICCLICAFVIPGNLFCPTRIIADNMSFLFVCAFIRMIYRISYKYGKQDNLLGTIIGCAIGIFSAYQVNLKEKSTSTEINVAIIGAGSSGICLSVELANSITQKYSVKCFIDIDPDKIGRRISDIPVISPDSADLLKTKYDIREIVLAIPSVSPEMSMELFSYYKQFGYNMKFYDDSDSIKKVGTNNKNLREIKIEDLLFRKSISTVDKKTSSYYKDKTVLITGGGGSIGSELCRQIAKMSPKKIVIVDVYENGAYDLQQEIKTSYDDKIILIVEILSVCDKKALEIIFDKFRPNIVIHAAAHKHVPFMENNCCEAVKNNVFGTLNAVELSEKYGADRFLMVSTDKAVNPTNVMGATKRVCEMIVQCMSTKKSKTVFTATRFGNVLGSAGSVIPLFKRQIAAGGPITLTDKRIVRYFMTIPEASQLVLTSGAMAKNGELFVLDMGKPVKILDLAENMIRLSGLEPYKDIEIREVGLRPGEKLYEELLVKTEELDKTENSLIFIERGEPLSVEALNQKIEILKKAVDTEDNEAVRKTLFDVVPTYKPPEIVNSDIRDVNEIQLAGVKK